MRQELGEQSLENFKVIFSFVKFEFHICSSTYDCACLRVCVQTYTRVCVYGVWKQERML